MRDRGANGVHSGAQPPNFELWGLWGLCMHRENVVPSLMHAPETREETLTDTRACEPLDAGTNRRQSSILDTPTRPKTSCTTRQTPSSILYAP